MLLRSPPQMLPHRATQGRYWPHPVHTASVGLSSLGSSQDHWLCRDLQPHASYFASSSIPHSALILTSNSPPLLTHPLPLEARSWWERPAQRVPVKGCLRMWPRSTAGQALRTWASHPFCALSSAAQRTLHLCLPVPEWRRGRRRLARLSSSLPLPFPPSLLPKPSLEGGIFRLGLAWGWSSVRVFHCLQSQESSENGKVKMGSAAQFHRRPQVAALESGAVVWGTLWCTRGGPVHEGVQSMGAGRGSSPFNPDMRGAKASGLRHVSGRGIGSAGLRGEDGDGLRRGFARLGFGCLPQRQKELEGAQTLRSEPADGEDSWVGLGAEPV